MPSRSPPLAVTSIALLVVGVILLALSFVPIPYVEKYSARKDGDYDHS